MTKKIPLSVCGNGSLLASYSARPQMPLDQIKQLSCRLLPKACLRLSAQIIAAQQLDTDIAWQDTAEAFLRPIGILTKAILSLPARLVKGIKDTLSTSSATDSA